VLRPAPTCRVIDSPRQATVLDPGWRVFLGLTGYGRKGDKSVLDIRQTHPYDDAPHQIAQELFNLDLLGVR
jgi:hypothetical protein